MCKVTYVSRCPKRWLGRSQVGLGLWAISNHRNGPHRARVLNGGMHDCLSTQQSLAGPQDHRLLWSGCLALCLLLKAQLFSFCPSDHSFIGSVLLGVAQAWWSLALACWYWQRELSSLTSLGGFFLCVLLAAVCPPSQSSSFPQCTSRWVSCLTSKDSLRWTGVKLVLLGHSDAVVRKPMWKYDI